MKILEPKVAKKQSHRALTRCDTLSKISEMQGAIFRQYLTKEHKQCNQLVSDWMKESGLTTWQDSVGNQWGRLSSSHPNAKSLIIGSHLDTVPNAGAYDGILGVMLAIELVALVKTHDIQLPFHVDIVGFCDEEGSRFATTLIGSKALAGKFDANWLALNDAQGVSMKQAMTDFGLVADEFSQSALNPQDILNYWEVHIEQGPVLESQQQALGIVTGIAGAKRALITFIGRNGHAGTTPMHLRHDALAACAELVVEIEKLANNAQHDEVATVGQIQASPGATNVISGKAEISLDARAQSDEALALLVANIEQTAQQIANKRGLTLNWQWTHSAQAVDCDNDIKNIFQLACTANNEIAPSLPSGAGHDAMSLATICPIGMLFIRSPGGISHHPDESVNSEDVAKALAVLYSAITQRASDFNPAINA